MKRVKILFFCMIIVVMSAFSQQNSVQPNTVKGYRQYSFSTAVTSFPPLVVKNVVSPNFYVNNLSFFCKQELKMQTLTGIPFKFRLGTVQQCDWLEGKKSAGWMPNR